MNVGDRVTFIGSDRRTVFSGEIAEISGERVAVYTEATGTKRTVTFKSRITVVQAKGE
jgi:hypothetical protein